METSSITHNAHIITHLTLLITLHNDVLERVRSRLTMLLELLTRNTATDVRKEAENELMLHHSQVMQILLHRFSHENEDAVELREHLEELRVGCRRLVEEYEDLQEYVRRCEEAVKVEMWGLWGEW